MIVHYILFFITVLFAKVIEKDQKDLKTSDQQQQETRASFIAAIVVYLPAIIMYGLRDNMGDTKGYVDTFNNLNVQGIMDNISERNPGYSVLQNFVKLYITDNANIFLLIITIASLLFLIKTYSNYSPMFALSTFVFFGSTEVSYVFNGARQFLAISIMFYSLKFIKEKKLLKYIILSVIALSIHQTAIIVVPAYFIARGKFLNMKIIVVGLATVAATAFSSLFINYLNDLFISESVYSHYYDQLVNTNGINIFRVLVSAIPAALCIVYKKRIDELNDSTLNISANMSTLAFAVSVFSATAGGDLLGRLAEYYLIYNTLTYPLLLKRIISKEVSRVLEIALIAGYLVFFFYQFTVIWKMGYQSGTLGLSIGMEDI